MQNLQATRFEIMKIRRVNQTFISHKGSRKGSEGERSKGSFLGNAKIVRKVEPRRSEEGTPCERVTFFMKNAA